ncbi:MAG: hypothetical protein JWN48_1153, partial [Myxococcaceae bacterium]|nr:hypothetical protein [Myxococcaceae bacterium]
MAPCTTKQTVRSWLFRRTLLRVALCLPSVTLNSGCYLVGYGSVAPSADAGLDSDGGTSNDASDSSSDSEVAFDAETDGSALDASDGSRDAEGEGGPDDAQLDGSAEGGTDSSTDGASPQCDGMVCTARCNLTGTYALKLTVPATWPTTAQIRSGSGNF